MLVEKLFKGAEIMLCIAAASISLLVCHEPGKRAALWSNFVNFAFVTIGMVVDKDALTDSVCVVQFSFVGCSVEIFH